MELKEVRDQRDKIDDAIFELLKQRHYLVKEIFAIKKIDNIPLEDNEREREILERLGVKAEESELDTAFVKKLFTIMIESSKEKHLKEAASGKEEGPEDPVVDIATPEDGDADSDTGEKHDSDII